jgi:hypothetical protein
MKKAYYRLNSAWIKLLFSNGDTILVTNCAIQREGLKRDGFDLVLLVD